MKALLTLALVFVALAVGACGGSSSTDTLSTATVIDTFREQTGHHLARSSRYSIDGTWDALVFDDTDPAREWGRWTVYVVTSDDDDTALTSDDAGRPLKADATGIYWDRQEGTLGEHWNALKRYGPNVYLLWFGGRSREASLGAEFDRVDTALRALE